MAEVQLDLLGPPLIRVGGHPVQINARKPVALLAYLAVTGQPHTRDFLAGLLWPAQSQSTALAYLRNALWVLGKAGLGDCLSAGSDLVSLQPGFRLDLAEFREWAERGLNHAHPPEKACLTCLQNLRAAADRFRDDFLAGFFIRDSPDFEDWQAYQAETLRQELTRVLEHLVQQAEALGDPEQAIPSARRWVSLDPLHEPAYRALMRLYALSGKRALAVRQYETLTRLLDQELGAKPEEASRQLFETISAGRLQPEKQATAAIQAAEPVAVPATGQSAAPVDALAPPEGIAIPHNLPAQLTSFIGRQRDIAQVLALLENGSTRLLTITGPGGSGKTRLSLQVAGRLVERSAAKFPDGVFFIDLSTVNREELVPMAISRGLGMLETPGRSPVELLKDHLRGRRLFLVLDNFEHVIGSAALVADLLTAAPLLTALVTSREILRLYGEQVYDLPPLELPVLGPGTPTLELVENEAVQLFAQRARAARPAFSLTDENASLAAQICVHLDGLPLAIELAAARAALLPLEQLRSQLDDRLKALRGGPRNAHARQRTLRDTIDWSYNLLSETEMRLFARLAVFHGSRCIEAVEQICLPDLDLNPVEALESLHDKSLLRSVPDADGEPRFTMLDTIREYALDKLEGMGEADEMRHRHARYYLEMAQRAQPDLYGGPRQVEWLDRLESEHSELRAALLWSLSGGDVELGQRLAGALMMFWSRHYHFVEWEWWVTRSLNAEVQTPPDVRARLLFSLGMCTYFQQVPQAGIRPLRESVALYRQLGDRHSMAWSLVSLGIVLAFGQPESYAEALSLGEEGLEIFRELGDLPAIAQALNILGELTRNHGDFTRARLVYEESLAVAVEIGDRLRQIMLFDNLGFVAYHEGNFEQAVRYFMKSLVMSREVDVKAMSATTLAFLGGAVGAAGRPDRGALLMGASEALRQSMAFDHQPADQVEVDRFLEDLQARLPAHALTAAWEEGRALAAHGIEKVLAFVLPG